MKAIIERELRAYFLSPMAYVILVAFSLMNGLLFNVILNALLQPDAEPGPVMQFYLGGNEFIWVFILFVVPVLTMRTFSEEIANGTMEMLMTAPVDTVTVIWAKYLSAVIMYAALWVPTLIYPIILQGYTDLDWGPIISGYFGLMCIGLMFNAVGIACSLFTRNQVVAAILTLMVLVSLFGIGLFEFLAQPGWIKSFLGYVNLWQHMNEFSKGLIHTRHLVYYGSVVWLCLFIAQRKAELRQWT